MPNLLNKTFPSYSLTIFDFLLPHTAHFDNINALSLLFFETTGSMLCVFFLHFKQGDKIVLYLRL